ncbi:16S rRNA (cytosine(1402)-N(4))-methyltransferase RsmH [bacterium]|nr:MAG: 16S rRNA (cytosine(1402)-N(4))-methyltransferase RsmH [bacterium]
MHIPVLERELIEYLRPAQGDNFIDCTLGEGGHAEAILEATTFNAINKSIGGKLLGIEIDKDLHQRAQTRLAHYGSRVIAINDSYTQLKNVVDRIKPPIFFKGIYFDLGACLWHFHHANRGFSFNKYEENLDMRFGQKGELKASDILNTWHYNEIEKCLRVYGNITNSKKLATAIINQRRKKKIRKTKELIDLIEKSFPRFSFSSNKQLIRKTFQALRISVNDELNNIEKGLDQATEILTPGGRIAVISYHSLEDKIVKKFFGGCSQLKSINKKSIKPTILERRFNPSARSAKLRVAIKT